MSPAFIFISLRYLAIPIIPNRTDAITTLNVTISIGVNPKAASFLTKIAISPQSVALTAINTLGTNFFIFNLTDIP